MKGLYLGIDVGSVSANTIIMDSDIHHARFGTEINFNLAGGSVPGDIIQCFLRDAVQRGLYVRGQHPPVLYR